MKTCNVRLSGTDIVKVSGSTWEFSVEGYYKQMRNVLEYKEGVSFLGSSSGWENKVEMGIKFKIFTKGITYFCKLFTICPFSGITLIY